MLPKKQKMFFLRWKPHCGEMIGAVAYKMEKWSALLATTQKNVFKKISINLKPYSNLQLGFNQWTKLMYFMKKS
jgi:hypothetical protein